MVLTNTLLSIGFGIATNFTATVPVPERAMLSSPTNVANYLMGMTGSPLHLFLSDGKTGFWIDHGIVYVFTCPGSYFHLQDPNLIPRYAGKAQLGTNEVLELATRVVHSLTKTGDPLSNA